MTLYDIAKDMVQRLTDAGHTAYFAGGWVRDHLLRIECADIDIATSATPQQVMALFDKTVPVGLEFGSVVVVEAGHPFEVTTFREEGPYVDGRHPTEVRPSDAQADASRRGLTINGMFYDPLKEEVLDFVGGKADLEKKIIRAIGVPEERFEEDKLRLLRAVRFAARLGFTIEPQTAAAIRKKADQLPVVSVERIWQELVKASAYPSFPDFLLQLQEFGLLQQFMPPIESVEPLRHYPDEAPTIALIAGLRPHASLESQIELGRALKVSNRDIQLIERLYQLRELLAHPDPVGWVHFYALKEADLLLKIAAAHGEVFLEEHLQAQKRLAPHIARVREKKPLVSAKQLIAAGIEPGKRLGELLARAERLAIEEDLHDSQTVVSRVLGKPGR